MIIHEITEDDLIDYRNKRKAETFSPSNRTINMEIGTLRQVLKKNRLWLALMEGSDFRNLKENKDVGRELTEEEAARLLLACAKSSSQAIYAAVKLAIYTGMRSAELKRVQWKHVDFEAAILTVGKSKTEAGSGREIHLNRNAVVLLQQRQEIFPGAKGEHYVFPSQQYTWKTLKGGTGRGTGVLVVGKTFLDRPITKLDSAWYRCLEVANVKCRWHDLRHTAASIMAAAGASDQVLLAHFGWMSRKMIERYSHVRAQAKKQAVAAAFDNWNVEQMLHLPETAAIIQ
jgi:integrase